MSNRVIEDLTDKYFELRAKKAEINRNAESEVAAVDHDIDRIKAAITAFLEKNKLTGIKVPGATLTMTKPKVVEVMDRAAFMDYIKETGDIALLQFRPSTSRVKEIIGEDGELGSIPGVSLKVNPTLQVRKAKEKK